MLRIASADFWHEDDRQAPVLRVLTRASDLTWVDLSSADLVAYNMYGFAHHRARGTRLAASIEPYERDHGAHWTIDSRLDGDDHHLHLPPWVYMLGSWELPTVPDMDAPRPHFCNFIVSNPTCRMRNEMFAALHARRPVHSLGSFLTNHHDERLSERGSDEWWRTKFQVLGDYRFTLAFENCSRPGYATEKLVDAWMAGSVPIYWGDPEVTRDIPPEAMIRVVDRSGIAAAVEEVLAAEADPARYRALQEANPVRTGELADVRDRYWRQLEEFCGRVLGDAAVHAGQSRTTAWQRAAILAADVVAVGRRSVARRGSSLLEHWRTRRVGG